MSESINILSIVVVLVVISIIPCHSSLSFWHPSNHVTFIITEQNPLSGNMAYILNAPHLFGTCTALCLNSQICVQRSPSVLGNKEVEGVVQHFIGDVDAEKCEAYDASETGVHIFFATDFGNMHQYSNVIECLKSRKSLLFYLWNGIGTPYFYLPDRTASLFTFVMELRPFPSAPIASYLQRPFQRWSFTIGCLPMAERYIETEKCRSDRFFTTLYENFKALHAARAALLNLVFVTDLVKTTNPISSNLPCDEYILKYKDLIIAFIDGTEKIYDTNQNQVQFFFLMLIDGRCLNEAFVDDMTNLNGLNVLLVPSWADVYAYSCMADIYVSDCAMDIAEMAISGRPTILYQRTIQFFDRSYMHNLMNNGDYVAVPSSSVFDYCMYEEYVNTATYVCNSFSCIFQRIIQHGESVRSMVSTTLNMYHMPHVKSSLSNLYQFFFEKDTAKVQMGSSKRVIFYLYLLRTIRKLLPWIGPRLPDLLALPSIPLNSRPEFTVATLPTWLTILIAETAIEAPPLSCSLRFVEGPDQIEKSHLVLVDIAHEWTSIERREGRIKFFQAARRRPKHQLWYSIAIENQCTYTFLTNNEFINDMLHIDKHISPSLGSDLPFMFQTWSKMHSTNAIQQLISRIPEFNIDEWMNRTTGIVVMYSNADDFTNRMAFAEELSKYFPVFNFGKLGWRGSSGAKSGVNAYSAEGPALKSSIIKNYKFVMSFENANCPGYVSQQVFQGLAKRTIPVFYGNREACETMIPSRSSVVFKHEYKNAESLAAYLWKISRDRETASKVMQWAMTPHDVSSKFHQFLQLGADTFPERLCQSLIRHFRDNV